MNFEVKERAQSCIEKGNKMKDTFLTDVVKQLIGSGKKIETLKLIVPSRRAVKFLKEALKKEIDRPIFAPTVVSIEDFVTELSGIEKVSPIELQLLFYQVYKKKYASRRTTFIVSIFKVGSFFID